MTYAMHVPGERPYRGRWPDESGETLRLVALIDHAIEDWWGTDDPRPSMAGAIAAALIAEQL